MLLAVYRGGSAYFNDSQELSTFFTVSFYLNRFGVTGHYRWFGGRLCV